MPTITKGSEADLAMKLIVGTQKHLSAITQLIVGSSTFTPAQVEAQLQVLPALRKDVDAAKAALKAKLENERTKAPASRVFLATFVGFVRSAFAGSPDVLADFGLQPKKARKPATGEQLAAAKAKRDATRKARGTMGKKKKLAIKGDVKGILVTPITAPSPAPVAPSTSGAPLNGGGH